MPNIPLPERSEPFSTGGFAKLYERVRREDLSVRQEIAQAIADDPRAALEYVFRLSDGQKKALEKMSDEALHSEAQPIVEQLRSDHPAETIWIVPDTAAAGTSERYIMPSCSCIQRPQ